MESPGVRLEDAGASGAGGGEDGLETTSAAQAEKLLLASVRVGLGPSAPLTRSFFGELFRAIFDVEGRAV